MSFRFALRGALVAACLFSTPALADTFLAEFRDLGGTTTMARFDLATGNALSGVRLDANPTGDNAPIPWGGIGDFAFDKNGDFWTQFKDLGGTTTMARFDLTTGNVLSGVRLDANPTGDNAPIPWGGIGGFAFEPEPGTSAIPEPASWAMLICGIAVVGGLMRRKGEGMHFVAFASAA